MSVYLRVKRIIILIKNKIDWIMIIMGVYLASYSLLNFRITAEYGGGFDELGTALSGPYTAHAWGYYYTRQTQIMFAVGVALIIWGILLHKEKAKMK